MNYETQKEPHKPTRPHETGRVSAIWPAKTTGQEDAHKWTILTPPTTGPKRAATQEWLQTRKNTQQQCP